MQPHFSPHLHPNVITRLKFSGLFFEVTNDFAEQSTINWQIKVSTAIKMLNEYKAGKLMFPGKIIFVSSYILSLFHYISAVFYPTTKNLANIKKHIFKFIWYPLIAQRAKQDIFFLPKDKGGWGLEHLPSRANATALKQVLRNGITPDDAHPIKYLMHYYFAIKLRTMFPDQWRLSNGPNVFKPSGPYKILLPLTDKLELFVQLSEDLYKIFFDLSSLPKILVPKHPGYDITSEI